MSYLPKTIGSELLRAETAFWNLHKHSTRDHGIVERQISMDSDVTERVFGICVGPFNTKPVEPVITAELLSFRKTFSTRGSPVLYNQHDGRVERDISLDTCPCSLNFCDCAIKTLPAYVLRLSVGPDIVHMG